MLLLHLKINDYLSPKYEKCKKLNSSSQQTYFKFAYFVLLTPIGAWGRLNVERWKEKMLKSVREKEREKEREREREKTPRIRREEKIDRYNFA